MDKQPYSDIMAFMPYDNYRSIIFITARTTRKYSNLKNHPECSMFIDDRRNKTSDCLKAHGVNASGKACELKPGLESAQIAQMFLKRHPALEDFIKSPTVAIFKLAVDTYYFVENFQEVTEIHLD
jgi:uncharacterized pyridoxamine 5'-phosphate oxidase family protein